MQDALTNFIFYRDELGNPFIELTVNGETISQSIQNADETIINLSLQVGTMTASYEIRREEAVFSRYDITDGESYYSINPGLNINREVNSSSQVETLEVSYVETKVVVPASEEQRVELLMMSNELSKDDVSFLLGLKVISLEELTPNGDTFFNGSPRYIAWLNQDDGQTRMMVKQM